MRLFTAIDIPEALADTLASLQNPETLDARWTDPDQFHVTLRFIGNASDEQAVRYEEALATIDLPPVHCEPYGLDVLPSRRSPRVLMLGLERTPSMMALYDSVSDTLEAEGLDPDPRNYRPHVTVARLDDGHRTPVHNYLRTHKDASFPAFDVDQFVLYKSTLTPEGAIHEPQAIYPLHE